MKQEHHTLSNRHGVDTFFHTHWADFCKWPLYLWNFRMFLLKRKLPSICPCIHRHKKAHCLLHLSHGLVYAWVLMAGLSFWLLPGSPWFPAPAQDRSSVVIALSVLLLPVVGGATLSFPEGNEHTSRHSWRSEVLLDSSHRELPNRETSGVPGWLRLTWAYNWIFCVVWVGKQSDFTSRMTS